MWTLLIAAFAQNPPPVPVTEADYQAQCDRDELWYCRKLGERYLSGDLTEVPDGGAKAKELFTKGCDAQDAQACANLAQMHYDGTHISAFHLTAARLFDQACQLGDPPSCAQASFMYGEGLNGVPKKPQKYFELSQKACEARDGWGCHLLGVAYNEGVGVGKDPVQALEAFRQACARQGNKDSCKMKLKVQKQVDKLKD